ncbi:MAG: hypothetical protein AB1916_15455 [Thermodesulfobacteriota bacterium]
MRRVVLLLAVLALSLAACKRTYFGNELVDAPAALDVAFADAKWDGKNVPADEVCKPKGAKNPMSPRLAVSGIPAGADTLIVEFNDLSYAPLSSGGGHGAISVAVPKGQTSVTVPATPGETKDMPAGVTLVKLHGGDVPGLGAGGYLPPCSGGRGNLYQARVHAVDSAAHRVLGQGEIKLGRY